MQVSAILDILQVLGSLGAIATGCAAVLAIVRYIKSQSITNELLYGEEAIERYGHIKENMSGSKATALKTVRYGGSTATLTVPRLEIRKISSSSKTVSKEWKGRRAIVKFYEENGKVEEGKKIIEIERWLI